ncbi:lipase (class 3) [Sinobacterium caligoides]|uniref:Lipase (Class 3) n=1 Tax=Sinobacterium caligoides TaxID=933926 RepID=A0A3N2DKE3_9GAMM|nr:hypothetical protein [Sinobacterium caligoides]ROS00267.1 lipase (class 3) [Sinobacterium caligoides]
MSTYMQAYGINSAFIERSQLSRKKWALNDNNEYLVLNGEWENSSITALAENYFVVTGINDTPVSSEDVHSLLQAAAQSTIENQYGQEYSQNVSYFASNRSAGYEYPILSQQQVAEIRDDDLFDYAALLRYAFASKYVYTLEEGADPFPYFDNPQFRQLMLFSGNHDLEVIDTFLGDSGVLCTAIKVPAVPEQGLEEEVIIAYKGTSNGGDIVQDAELAIANFYESDVDWQADAYAFFQRIVSNYPVNNQSVADGYHNEVSGTSYKVTLTGHSLGAYTAADVSARSGVLARVFSCPATRIIERYSRVFANQLRLNSVVSFYRDGDPVAELSGRHDENMVCFPGTGSVNVFNNHFLVPFIDDIIARAYLSPSDSTAQPRYVYVTPDATPGSGLKGRINRWG